MNTQANRVHFYFISKLLKHSLKLKDLARLVQCYNINLMLCVCFGLVCVHSSLHLLKVEKRKFITFGVIYEVKSVLTGKGEKAKHRLIKRLTSGELSTGKNAHTLP